MNASIQRLRPLIKARQYRHFASEPVGDEGLGALAEVARWSGSSRNTQPWRFMVVRDVALIRRIAEIGHPQTRALQTAPAVFAITLPVDEARTVSHAYDEGRVAERVLIGASMLGLGAGVTWIRADVREEIGALLGEGRLPRPPSTTSCGERPLWLRLTPSFSPSAWAHPRCRLSGRWWG